jgi:5-methyltetrahydropteroyltriglutamate--homocysteine methyltransferase
MHSSPVHLFGPECNEITGHSQMVFVREKHTLLWPAVPSVAAKSASAVTTFCLDKRCGPWPFFAWRQPTTTRAAAWSTGTRFDGNGGRQLTAPLRAGRVSAATLILRIAATGWHTRRHNVGGQLKFQWEECMHKSVDHILTTHTGSLPRGAELNDLLIAEEAGEQVDKAKLTDRIEKRVAYVMEKQRWAGVDIANDGEQGRVGFQTYIPKRMHGFGGESKRPFGREWIELPLFTEKFSARIPKTGKVFGCPECTGELKYHDKEAIKTELDRFKRAAATIKPPFAEMFFAEPSPGIIATTMLNAHYSTYEGYLDAIAREMHYEYKSVVDAGLVLQIDAPDLAMERVLLFQDKSDAEYVKVVESHVTALNKALEGIPRDRVRLHICWGNWEGPHIYDIGLEPLLPAFYQAHVGGLSIEFANARRQHEYNALKKHKFPDNMVLLPGVIDSKINLVEHPEVVAQRIEQAVAAVGDRERVIASSDCGFGTFAGWEWVAEDVVWLKLKTMREGADIATNRLWGRKAA